MKMLCCHALWVWVVVEKPENQSNLPNHQGKRHIAGSPELMSVRRRRDLRSGLILPNSGNTIGTSQFPPPSPDLAGGEHVSPRRL